MGRPASVSTVWGPTAAAKKEAAHHEETSVRRLPRVVSRSSGLRTYCGDVSRRPGPWLAVVPLVVVLAGCGGETSTSGRDPGAEVDLPVVLVDGEVQVSCGGESGWPTSAMADGIEPPVPAEEISVALDAIATEPGLSAETGRVLPDGGRSEWRVLAGDDQHLFLGIGSWTDQGPSQDPDDQGRYMSLELENGKWTWRGHGDCRRLIPLLEQDGMMWVELSAPGGGLDRTSTTLTVGVNEIACTSSRDPEPFLQSPSVVETEESVTIYWTSEAPTGAQACPGNPTVEQQVTLAEPLGDRELLDASTWPPAVVG